MEIERETVVLVVEHEVGCPLGRLEPLLAEARLDIRRPWAGDPLPSGRDALDGVDALVVLGGEMAAWDDDVAPWLPATRALLARAASGGVPALGLCLGAQLLALATGGRVERGAVGPEAGLLPVRASAAGRSDALVGAVVASLGQEWTAAQSHGDAITALPADAELLASSDLYPVQALRVGERAWGVQYHPEVVPADLLRWLRDGHTEQLAARGSTLEAERVAVADAEPSLAELASVHARVLLEQTRRQTTIGGGRRR
ncbi:type 1 glutamine amidotransferase [Quadrisphaera granulorum]|uniref:type 1 glutamine amidotransferase n=1 Tax=Quadrisphaera granulorum TaxID=317664 RepID=UPI001B865107|nr:type 1 glutamine amidotransferase [Quadrisphaera granulorum]